MKRCSKKECCKQCRHVKFKGTMTKWPVYKQTHRTTQKRLKHQDATDIQKQNYFCWVFIFHFSFYFNFIQNYNAIVILKQMFKINSFIICTCTLFIWIDVHESINSLIFARSILLIESINIPLNLGHPFC